MFTCSSSKHKHDNKHAPNNNEDSLLEAAVPDYGDVVFRQFLRSTKFRNSIFSTSAEDEEERPLKTIRAKLVLNDEGTKNKNNLNRIITNNENETLLSPPVTPGASRVSFHESMSQSAIHHYHDAATQSPFLQDICYLCTPLESKFSFLFHEKDSTFSSIL